MPEVPVFTIVCGYGAYKCLARPIGGRTGPAPDRSAKQCLLLVRPEMVAPDSPDMVDWSLRSGWETGWAPSQGAKGKTRVASEYEIQPKSQPQQLSNPQAVSLLNSCHLALAVLTGCTQAHCLPHRICGCIRRHVIQIESLGYTMLTCGTGWAAYSA